MAEGARLIKEGDTVIFDVSEDKQAIISVRPKTKVKLGRAYFPADPLIGSPFGSIFTVSADGKRLERTQHVPSTEWDAPVEITRDNSKLVDGNSANQQLTQGDVLAMREAGAGGDEIIEALTSNSATFHAKTEFAQEKYKRRKAKKYVSVAVARRPTAATVASAYFCSKPLRVGYLRFDALALMLGMANVGAHSRVLVMESCGGLVTAAVAERLGGHGVVCRTFAGPNAPSSMEIAKTFNFDGRVMESLRMVPLSRLLEQRQRQIDGKTAAAPAAAAAPPPSQEAGAAGVDSMEQDAAEVEVAVAIDGEAADAAQPAAADAAPDAAAAPQLQDGAPAPPAPPAPPAGLTHGPPYSGLILACPEVDAVSAMRRLLPLLAPSASFAVYSRSIQPLAECMAALRADGLAVNLTLQECWYREQQVLPGRTHPTMVMNHGGGCLLSGCATLQGTSLPTGVEGAGAAGGV